jgi:hypothetical protein
MTTWLENLKVGDKVGVCCPNLGNSQDLYYIGVVSKANKTKIEVQVIGSTRTFGRSTGTTKVYKWDLPDRLVEPTPEVLEKVHHRRLMSSVTKALKDLKIQDLSLEQLKVLENTLTTLQKVDTST